VQYHQALRQLYSLSRSVTPGQIQREAMMDRIGF
jgi:hypothetical protein